MIFISTKRLPYFLTSILVLVFLLVPIKVAMAQNKGAKMTICQQIDGRTPGEKTGSNLKAVNPTNTFEAGGINSFAVLLEFPPFKDSQRIDIDAYRIDGSSEYKASGDAVIVSKTDTKAYIIGLFSLVGEYKVKAVCNDVILAESKFTVTKSSNPPHAVLSICKDIDNDLNPVGASTSFDSGASIKFHAAFPRHNGQRFVFWSIFKDNGQEESFVDNFQMSVKSEWRTFATDDLYTFPEPGKYSIYLLDYEQGNSSYKPGNYEKYLGKIQVVVK